MQHIEFTFPAGVAPEDFIRTCELGIIAGVLMEAIKQKKDHDPAQ